MNNTRVPRKMDFMAEARVAWITITLCVDLIFIFPNPCRHLLWIPYSVLLPLGIIYGNKTQQRIRREELENKGGAGAVNFLRALCALEIGRLKLLTEFRSKLLKGRILRNALCLIILVMITSCSEYKMDSFQSWCNYQLKDIKTDVVSIDRNAVREDFANFLNEIYMKQVEGRIDRMAWIEGKHLHIENLSTLFEIEPSQIIEQYRSGVKQYKENKAIKNVEECFYGAIFHFFDDVTIHSGEPDSFGLNWEYTETVIKTHRRDFYKKSIIPVLRKMVEDPTF